MKSKTWDSPCSPLGKSPAGVAARTVRPVRGCVVKAYYSYLPFLGSNLPSYKFLLPTYSCYLVCPLPKYLHLFPSSLRFFFCSSINIFLCCRYGGFLLLLYTLHYLFSAYDLGWVSVFPASGHLIRLVSFVLSLSRHILHMLVRR